MQHHCEDKPEEVSMMKLLSKIQTLEAQKSPLTETINQKELLNSNIISSLQPRVGKEFQNTEIEQRKQSILRETRKKLLRLAIKEKEIQLTQSSEQFEQLKEEYTKNDENSNLFFTKTDKLIDTLTQKLNSTMNKKVMFHGSRQQSSIKFVNQRAQAKKKRKWTTNRKRKNRTAYKKKVKERKQSKISAFVTKIKESNTVINLSTEEIPDSEKVN